MSRILNAEEVASILRVDKLMIYRLANEGRLPSFRVGRFRRFNEDEIYEFARGERQEPAGAAK